MRMTLFVLILVLIQNTGSGQEELFRKNTISLESGFFSRGLLGISYSRKFLKTEYFYPSADIFFGAGTSGFYYGLGANLNLGREEVFFVLGIDGKKFEYEYDESFLFKSIYFNGFAYNPYLGLNLFTPSGLSIKTRAGFTPLYVNRKYDGYFLSAGISIGYSF